jgi:hypothetical protein
MNIRLKLKAIVLFSMVLLLTSACGNAFANGKSLPDFGVLFNDDGEQICNAPNPEAAIQQINSGVNSLAGTNVKTLIRNVGYGSEVLYYPSTAGSTIGWRTIPDEIAEQSFDKAWVQRVTKYMNNCRSLIDAGVDPLRLQGERAKEIGLRFIATHRMNDPHGIKDGVNNPLAGEFKVEHGAQYLIENKPDWFFDYVHEEYRSYKLGIILEFIDRYKDILDGVQLDFMRHPLYFTPPHGMESAHLITEMVSQVRQRLDELSEEQGKPYYLFVRVPSTIRDAKWAGLEVDKWISDRLVDVVTPALIYDLSNNMPVDEFVELAKKSGAKIYPNIILGAKYTGSRPFEEVPTADSYKTAEKSMITPELARAAASNYWHMGASGFEMFNWTLPLNTLGTNVQAALGDEKTNRDTSKAFAVTPYRENLWKDVDGKMPLPLPAKWVGSGSGTFDLYVGDKLKAEGRKKPDYVGVRLGLINVKETDTIELKVGDEVLYAGSAAGKLIPVTGTSSAVPLKETYFQIELDNLRVLNPGRNSISVAIAASDSARTVELTEVQLGVLNH